MLNEEQCIGFLFDVFALKHLLVKMFPEMARG